MTTTQQLKILWILDARQIQTLQNYWRGYRYGDFYNVWEKLPKFGDSHIS